MRQCVSSEGSVIRSSDSINFVANKVCVHLPAFLNLINACVPSEGSVACSSDSTKFVTCNVCVHLSVFLILIIAFDSIAPSFSEHKSLPLCVPLWHVSGQHHNVRVLHTKLRTIAY